MINVQRRYIYIDCISSRRWPIFNFLERGEAALKESITSAVFALGFAIAKGDPQEDKRRKHQPKKN